MIIILSLFFYDAAFTDVAVTLFHGPIEELETERPDAFTVILN